MGKLDVQDSPTRIRPERLMPTDDLGRSCCQNPNCTHYGRRGAGNLSACGHFAKAHHRLLYCNACKVRFSEFKGTPLFNANLPHDKVLAILQHLDDGCGGRQTARLVGVNKEHRPTEGGRVETEVVRRHPRIPRNGAGAFR